MLPSSTTSLVLSSVSSSFFLNSQAHGNTRLRQRLKPYQTIPAFPMATEEPAIVSQEPQATPKIPDYLASPNSVFGDEGVAWRYGRAPDYTKTRKEWVEGELVLFCRFHVHWPGLSPRCYTTSASSQILPRGNLVRATMTRAPTFKQSGNQAIACPAIQVGIY